MSKHSPDDSCELASGEGVEELAQAADRLFYAMRRPRTTTVGQSETGLSRAQLTLLAPLAEDAEARGLPVGRLAASAEVSVPTATRMLKQLEAKDVVTGDVRTRTNARF
ncbi:hypothetical protein [Streptomyces sp. NPDC051636]|uniref:hypothetical protein n=1 Tax=Streptomyces sp. NPDC051636 TaxID=3365663 RepID=UPI00379C739E